MINRWWRGFTVALSDDPQTRWLVDIGMLILAGLLSFVVFARVPVHGLSPNFQGEFRHHSLLLAALETKGSTPYSLWYVLQQALVGGNRDEVILLNSGWLMLGALAAFKGIVLTGVLFATSFSRVQALVIGFLLGTAVALPIPFLGSYSRLTGTSVNYLGTLPPNVFMSATQLMANTTAVVAIVVLTLWFQRPTNLRYAMMVATGLVATLSKPGIAPALVAAVALLSLRLIHTEKQDLRTASFQFAGVAALIGLPVLIAYTTFLSGDGWLDVHTEVRPFATWTAFTSHWFLDLLASWAFPIAVIIVLWATRNATPERREWLIPAWSVTIVATTMFALLAEVNNEGQVTYAGNFAWGAMAATSGLYVVSVIAVNGIAWKIRWLPLGVLTLQAIAGLHYINVYIDTGNFL